MSGGIQRNIDGVNSEGIFKVATMLTDAIDYGQGGDQQDDPGR